MTRKSNVESRRAVSSVSMALAAGRLLSITYSSDQPGQFGPKLLLTGNMPYTAILTALCQLMISSGKGEVTHHATS
jgi:hypothetical protein